MSAQKPRAAYCTGCGVTFLKMHILIAHRRTDRCGGRFLPPEERKSIDTIREFREDLLRQQRPERKVRSDLPWWEYT